MRRLALLSLLAVALTAHAVPIFGDEAAFSGFDAAPLTDLLQAARAPRADVRRAAVVAAERFGDLATPLFENAASDKDPAVAVEAWAALDRLGPPASVRGGQFRAARIDKAVGRMHEGIDERIAAVQELGIFGPYAAETVKVLRRALHEREPSLFASCVETLSRIRTPNAFRAIQTDGVRRITADIRSSDDSHRLRGLRLAARAEIREPEWSAIALESLRSPSAPVRAQAAATVATFRDEQAAPILKEMIRGDRDIPVRVAAIEALSFLERQEGGTATLAASVVASEGEKLAAGAWDADVYQAALNTLARLPGPAAEAARRRRVSIDLAALDSGLATRRNLAASELGAYGTDAARAVPALERRLSDASANVRVSATEALRTIGSNEARRALAARRKRIIAQLRTAAPAGPLLAELAAQRDWAGDAVDAVASAWPRWDERTRRTAEKTLYRIGTWDAVRAVERAAAPPVS